MNLSASGRKYRNDTKTGSRKDIFFLPVNKNVSLPGAGDFHMRNCETFTNLMGEVFTCIIAGVSLRAVTFSSYSLAVGQLN
jgi:hypothetical protein